MLPNFCDGEGDGLNLAKILPILICFNRSIKVVDFKKYLTQNGPSGKNTFTKTYFFVEGARQKKNVEIPFSRISF